MVFNFILIGCSRLIPIKVIIQSFDCKIPERVLLNEAISICRRFSEVSHWFEAKMCGLSLLAIFTFWVFTLWHIMLVLYSKRKSSITAPAPLTTKLISEQGRLNATKSVLVFSLYTHQLHFKTPLEFYACDWITTLSEQQYSQTLTDRFFAFSMLIFSRASSHTENPSCKWPGPEMETFFMSWGCPHRVSTVVIVMATHKEREQEERRRSEH